MIRCGARLKNRELQNTELRTQQNPVLWGTGFASSFELRFENLLGYFAAVAAATVGALVILPLLMQLVQTRMRLEAPFTRALTAWRLTFQRRRETLCAWEMLLPNCGPLPQISHTCAMTSLQTFLFRDAGTNTLGALKALKSG